MDRRCLVFALSVGLTVLTACQRGEDSAPSRPRKTEIALGAVISDQGCLNLQKYFEEVATLDQGLPVLTVSTRFDLQSKKPIRENFRKSMAYGLFLFDENPLGQIDEFPSVSQTGCKALTLKEADETAVEYKITAASEDALTIQSADGRRLHYRWLSPQSLEIERRYTAYDLPCADETEITVDTTRVLDWSGARPAVLSSRTTPLVIDPVFLETLGQAVGRDVAEVYEQIDGEAVVSAQKLREFAQAPLIDDLKACGREDADAPVNPEPAPSSDIL